MPIAPFKTDTPLVIDAKCTQILLMRHITIALPDELSAALAAPGQDLSRAAFEALALAAYRERKISAAQLRQLLGYETRMEVDAFLKSHGVELEYTLEDIERDRETHRQLGM
jgi:chromosome segregation and condensation protein ScpB